MDMNKCRKTWLIAVVVLVVIVVQLRDERRISVAQDGDEAACTVLIEDALQLVGTACVEMGRNEACYGNNAIEVELQADVTASFEDSGDLVEVGDLVSLVTEPANPEAGTWGVAFMAVQADLPDDSDENVTFILVGDVEVSHDETFEDESTQAFLLESREGEMCEDAPDGLLIHSPEGTRTRIVVNGVELDMSSAAFITAERDQDMTIQGLEGHFHATADGRSVLINPGFMTTVPLDGLLADGVPTPAQAVDPSIELPTDVLAGLITSVEAMAASDPAFGGVGLRYSDSTLALNYPEGWVFELVSGDPTTLGFSNDPEFFAAWLADNSTPLPSGTLRGAIYRYNEFAELTNVEGESAQEVLLSHSETAFAQDRITQAPTEITLDERRVTHYTLQLELPDGRVLGVTHYSFERFIMVVIVGEPSETFDPVIEAIIGSVDVQ
jgi:hypothetical protein